MYSNTPNCGHLSPQPRDWAELSDWLAEGRSVFMEAETDWQQGVIWAHFHPAQLDTLDYAGRHAFVSQCGRYVRHFYRSDLVLLIQRGSARVVD